MIPILDSRQMRAADEAAIRGGVPSARLMENAATALAEELLALDPRWRRVVVVCGPGNNGGDGLAAARLLDARGLAVSVFTLQDPSLYRGDAAENASRGRQAGLLILSLSDQKVRRAFRRSLAEADGIVDALFGTGLSRGLEGLASRVVSAINSARRPVVSVDLPSGLSAESGRLIGPCVSASLTVAFAAAKHCHAFPPARERCGRLVVRDIGISRKILDRQKSPLRLIEEEDVRSLLPARPADSHKADFGRLGIIAGSRGKAGAAVLAARGALRAGAGLVTVFCPASIETVIVTALPEAMTRALPDRDGVLAEEGAAEMLKALREFDAAVTGPGLGTASGTVALLEELFSTRLPLVCDADALNSFPGRPQFFSRRAPTVLTPHPGEAGRLLGRTSVQVQADRLWAARALAHKSRAVVLLKGAASLTAAPSGRVTVNPTGTPLMATAGAGDVLAGALGAFLAGGMNAEEAAFAAAYLHGAAGDWLAASLADAGLLTSELADALPLARRALRSAGRSNWIRRP